MPDTITVQSHTGPYTVRFEERAFASLERGLTARQHLIVDKLVADAWGTVLKHALESHSVLQVEATEESKALERMPAYVVHLVERGIRRDHELIAVGGGVIQDITAFLAGTLLRGVPWKFYPTTLLAQADSCIGSKSSINVGRYKNQLGTFTPPIEVVVSLQALETLSKVELRSGVGEIIKAHIIAGWDDTRALARDYARLFDDKRVLAGYIRRALKIKKAKVEVDEFDRGPRLVMNYGHTFGHAIESASGYSVPHGIAVTIGMDMANFHALRLGLISADVYDELHVLLRENFRGFETAPIVRDTFFDALLKDKKHSSTEMVLVLLAGGPGSLSLPRQALDRRFVDACGQYLEALPASGGSLT